MEWYYEYVVRAFNPASKEEETFSGVVPAKNYAAAIQKLMDCYEEQYVMDIQALKPIIEAPVFEFNRANEEEDFDFEIKHKKGYY